MIVNGNVMTYEEYGTAERPALLLLSGWAQDHRLFKNIAPRLQKEFHVLSLNWRGHDEQHTVNADFGTKELADDVIAFTEALGLQRFRMVSHSHGCWVNIEVCDRLGIDLIDNTVLIDWLLQPHDGFLRQVREGRDPQKYEAARTSMFDEWAAATDKQDVLDHIYHEMPSFGGEMWMRANREIETAYMRWTSPIARMESLAEKPNITHIFSQPLLQSYRDMQHEYARQNSWFHPVHIPGNTHFPSLENPDAVADAITSAFQLQAPSRARSAR